MAKEIVSKQEVINRIGSMLVELDHFDFNQMYRDLEKLKSQLEDNDPDWRETWDETIDGCDPWGIAGMEWALNTKTDLGYVEVEADEETA